jgi:hypothetical protein
MVDNCTGHGDQEAGATAPLKAAFRLLLTEIRRLVWQILLLGSGFWLAGATSIEGLVVRLACSFEDAKPAVESRPLERSFAHVVHESIARVLRRSAPRVRTWREQAASFDAAMLSRRGFGD